MCTNPRLYIYFIKRHSVWGESASVSLYYFLDSIFSFIRPLIAPFRYERLARRNGDEECSARVIIYPKYARSPSPSPFRPCPPEMSSSTRSVLYSGHVTHTYVQPPSFSLAHLILYSVEPFPSSTASLILYTWPISICTN